MAVMNETQRANCAAKYQRDPELAKESLAGDKAGVRALIDAIDQYFSDHQAEINQSIPLPYRTQFTTKQKARAGIYVLRDRYIEDVS